MFNRYVGRFLSLFFSPFARIWSFMRRVIPGLKRLPTLKPEVLAALLSFVFLLTILIVHVILSLWWDPIDKPYRNTFLTLILINVALPIVIYFGVRIFLAPPKSAFPDIDLAFEAGLDALAKNGISLKQTPVYLVIGLADPKGIRRMMSVSKRTFDFSHVTSDGQALHWYGSAENTYLSLTGVGNVCQLTKDLDKYLGDPSSPEMSGEGDDYKGTIDVRALGKKNQGQMLSSDQDSEPAPVATSDGYTATIKAGEIGQPAPRLSPQASDPAPTKRPNRQLSNREKLALQKRRLSHLCALLKRHRDPVCAHNGIVVALANQLISEFPNELARQIKSDLKTICQKTGVISTVAAVITGFESDRGCREFVARLKETKGEGFLSRRFGESYRSWECPSAEHLKEISQGSVENFDQYIYSIFTQHDALSSRHVDGNREMVRFLCWIYARFFEGLESTLSTGFVSDDQPGEDIPRFAGCYFMGIGDAAEHQFFHEGVFDRVDENQGELEWTSRVLRREESLNVMSQLIFLVGLIAIVAFAVLVGFELSAK